MLEEERLRYLCIYGFMHPFIETWEAESAERSVAMPEEEGIRCLPIYGCVHPFMHRLEQAPYLRKPRP